MLISRPRLNSALTHTHTNKQTNFLQTNRPNDNPYDKPPHRKKTNHLSTHMYELPNINPSEYTFTNLPIKPLLNY
jgi:hypothetical protein